jgi:hypothetical protein
MSDRSEKIPGRFRPFQHFVGRRVAVNLVKAGVPRYAISSTDRFRFAALLDQPLLRWLSAARKEAAELLIESAVHPSSVSSV